MIAQEPWLRFSAFVTIFAIVAIAEALLPRRERRVARTARWPSNLGIVVLNTVTARLVLPVSAVGLADLAAARGWGLLHAVALPDWSAVVLAFVALDFAVYLQHLVFHAASPLWRLHRMHHADVEFDVSTALRFHTLEILLSFAWKFVVIVAIGAGPLAVLLFEIVLSSAAMFNHANLALPPRLDSLLRLVLVTPDMHRVHHSVDAAEQNTNYGFNLPWWDRLFGTYRAAPARGHDGMQVGLDRFRDERERRLDRMLTQPFR